MSTAVVTVVSGRHDHLRAQRAFLARCEPPPTVHVVVSMGDDGVAAVIAETPDLATEIVMIESTDAGLPVAAARNAGAARAIEHGVDQLVFLDVDCLPARDLLARYAAALGDHADAVVCGPVTYLPPTPAWGWTLDALRAARNPHAARPDPGEGEIVELEPQLFWSLSFAVTALVWRESTGFYEGYVGYGAEDTDFAACLVRAGVPILFVGGADAFHQHHAVHDPPVGHLDDIVRNSNVYLGRHGAVPMRGWLDAFAADGLVRDVTTGPRRTDAVRVATIPSRHPYLDAVLPPTIERFDVDRVRGWQPDPLFDPAQLHGAAGRIDVVHVHFGYDHLSRADLAAWLDALDAAGVVLVLTVHDLRNPHHDAPELHDAHLLALASVASRVVTLTHGAAAEFERLTGRQADVVPHPSLLRDDEVQPAAAHGRTHVLVPLKSLRRNVCDPVEVVRAAAEGAARAGLRVRVLVEPSALERRDLGALLDLDVDLDIAPYLPHEEVCTRVAAAHAVVLPYRFGTHSGWVELCHDIGTHVIAPDCGHYAEQWSGVRTYGNNERDGLDPVSLADAVAAACARPVPPPADRVRRSVTRDLARAHHDALYRQVVQR